MDDTTIYIGRKSWDFAEQYPSLKGFEDIGTAGNYFVALGSLGEKNDLYVVFNFVAGTLLKTFPGNNLIWQGSDLSTAVYSYWSGHLRAQRDEARRARTRERRGDQRPRLCARRRVDHCDGLRQERRA